MFHAIHGATLPASIGPGLAIHGKAFRLSKAALLIGCADQPSPIHGAAMAVSTSPGLASPATEHSSVALGTAREAALRKRLPSPLASRSALEKLRFSSAAPTGQPAFRRIAQAIHGAAMVASTSPGLAILGEPFGP